MDLKPHFRQRRRDALRQTVAELQSAFSTEKDTAVRQDLEILIRRTQQDIRGIELREKYLIPYFDIGELLFQRTRNFLNDHVPEGRRAKALIRLRKYAGVESGYVPITELAEALTREGLQDSRRQGPPKDLIEKTFANSATYLAGIADLFERYHLTEYRASFDKLRTQINTYNDFLRREVLPRARSGFREPAEMYAFVMEQVGVEMAPEQLAAAAHAVFRQIQSDMIVLAPKVAREKAIGSTDYRDVIRALKTGQWDRQSILREYKSRIVEIEAILGREEIVTLPGTRLEIRIGTEAESATSPNPFALRPPSSGKASTFVLPFRGLKAPEAGENHQEFDDFTYPAASWPLAAHEGRPGHALQFDISAGKTVSLARRLFSNTDACMEGWGLYSETILRPYMPAEGQLAALQFLLWRAARAFLDPELQMGVVTPAEATKVLIEDVMLSSVLARQEVERYTFRLPGQATAYLYGYMEFMRLRADTEKALGPRFQQRAFHDFLLNQGVLPLPLLRKAVFAQFVGQEAR